MKFKTYLEETQLELTKVTWPDRQKVIALVGVIFVIVAVVLGYVFLSDALLGFLMSLLRRIVH